VSQAGLLSRGERRTRKRILQASRWRDVLRGELARGRRIRAHGVVQHLLSASDLHRRDDRARHGRQPDESADHWRGRARRWRRQGDRARHWHFMPSRVPLDERLGYRW